MPVAIAIVETPEGPVAHIPLNRGKVALVDAADLPRIAPFRWYAEERNGRYFAAANALPRHGIGGLRVVRMHRIVLDLPTEARVAHRNGDTLDNRRANLCLVTQGVLQQARRDDPRNRSGYRGVSFDKQTRRWRATLKVDGRQVTLGRYDTAEDAARVRDAAARQEYGELAYLNFLRASEGA